MASRAEWAQQKKTPTQLHPVSDQFAAAVLTDGRHPLDRALKGVENVSVAGRCDLEHLVVLVSADLITTNRQSEKVSVPEDLREGDTAVARSFRSRLLKPEDGERRSRQW